MSLKGRQVAGVTTLVVVIVAVLSVFHLASLARLSLQESALRGDMLKQMIFQRARDVVIAAADPYPALAHDGSIRSLLESALAYSPNVVYAAIVNKDGIAIAHSSAVLEGQRIPEQEDLRKLVDERSSIALLRAVYSDRTYEVQQTLLINQQEFGSIRIGFSTLLVKDELRQALRQSLQDVAMALLLSCLVALLMSQWMLRPIHVIQSGLTRLGRGELNVSLDLPEGDEFKDLGTSFQAVSDQLSASRAKALSGGTDFESVVENLEDAVALFNPDGTLIFSNPAMAILLPRFSSAGDVKTLDLMAPPDHPVRQLVERTLAAHKGQGPVSVDVGEEEDRLVMTHPIDDDAGKFVGAILVARNLSYMNQVHSTLKYSQKLAAFGRLMAGVAHEVKNPLNAMTIHLELLRSKLQRQTVGSKADVTGRTLREPAQAVLDAPPFPDVSKHVDIIGKEIQRLDTVLNGFLKFARPDELKLQPLRLGDVISDIVTTIAPEAERMRVAVRQECPRDLPDINADPAMLRQALLNLALNAIQAMPNGGTLRIACRSGRGSVEIDIEDTGIGIPPEHLQRIFDLYFTTKEKGSGIGLSMVYRIVQLHDGDVEVQSTPGAGTRFKLIFPQA
ncbi:MAG TPA: ATP-binding protein [Vicinamibacterales bacterium]|jgi:signal transduction histidine kinase|nr:ATP-binding protein [Vicinamibacterales bacterium]